MAEKTLTLGESRVLIRDLIGDPDGDGLTDTQINLIYNMTYQRFHGEHIHNQVAIANDTSNNAPRTTGNNPYKFVRFHTSTTIRSILRVEIIEVFSRVPIERVSKQELLRRVGEDLLVLGIGSTNGQPTAYAAERHPRLQSNTWNFWFHPIPDGLITFYVTTETSPVDLTGIDPFIRPKGVTSGESVAIAHMAAYHCAMLQNRRDRMKMIIDTMPDVERSRFNLRDVENRPSVRPRETHV